MRIYFLLLLTSVCSSRLSIPAFLRLLEAIAKSIKHATAMSTILATEIFQARRDAVLATSKILLDNTNHELRNSPKNSKTLFGNKIKEVAKGNFEAQQQRFLATSSVATTSNRKWLIQLLMSLRDWSSQLNLLGLSKRSRTGLKVRQSYSSSRKEYAKRSGNQKQFPSSKQASTSTKSEVQPFPLPVLPCPDIPLGGRLTHFVEQWEELTDNKWVLSIFQNRFEIPFKSVPPLSVVPINLSQSSPPLLQEEIAELLKKQAVERIPNPGTPRFYSRLFLVPKKKNGKLLPVIDLSLLNQYINKQHFKMETVKSVRQSIMANDWAVSIDLMDAYLHVPIHPRSRKYLWFVDEHQVFQFMALPFGMSLSPWIFTKLMNVIAAHLRLRAVSLFQYLDDWLIRDLIHYRLISHTKYTLQTVQNLDLKKSDLIPAQEFTFIGMEFLTQQKIVRVSANRVKTLILTIRTVLSQTLFGHELSFLFWANSVQQQT